MNPDQHQTPPPLDQCFLHRRSTQINHQNPTGTKTQTSPINPDHNRKKKKSVKASLLFSPLCSPPNSPPHSPPLYKSVKVCLIYSNSRNPNQLTYVSWCVNGLWCFFLVSLLLLVYWVLKINSIILQLSLRNKNKNLYICHIRVMIN